MEDTEQGQDTQKMAEKTPWILQWNCRGIRNKMAELKLKLQRMQQNTPIVIILQELDMIQPKITGYRTYQLPTIIYNKKKLDLGQPCGATATFVREDVAQTALDTTHVCNELREVIAVRIRIKKMSYIVTNAYVRPRKKYADDMSWITNLARKKRKKEQLNVAGDFNAWEKTWGYRKNSQRGDSLKEHFKRAQLRPLNKKKSTTRFGNNGRETSPDLTFCSYNARIQWQTLPDPMGSDHFLIKITLAAEMPVTRETKFIQWDCFRMAFEKEDQEQSIESRISTALRASTKIYNVKEEAPDPDIHLLNLWASRLQAQQRYRKNRKNKVLRAKFNAASAKAKRYTIQLKRQNWQIHCQ
ncbi:hypothetical protein HPB47_006908 [Ixodes persulcatus]|uniref:Uncharacterized protein n=1 Tax=Ixodes persulcatus TaxID=34615 RepID=A0AC60R1M8_IXOPE|nr:hypothetical protein HPB47_006908 [Ixodes persulcatus]